MQHRCDDLKSLEYMLLYFLRESLSWQDLKITNQTQKKKLILKKKKTISTENLCESLSWEFAAYLNYIRFLDFDDKSKHFYLRKLFRALFVRESFDHDHVFDWTILKYLMTTQSRKILQGVDLFPDGAASDCLSGVQHDQTSSMLSWRRYWKRYRKKWRKTKFRT